jgi:2-polyprenyl-3-methyl-5-hydroxy-6-metoxy-1,4-benzoquinol methylase
MSDNPSSKDTSSETYTVRLKSRSSVWWKRVLDVQAPYRWNLRRLHLGRTLDIGCGIGRNLRNLGPGSIGVDHNATSIQTAREQGHEAYTLEEWEKSPARRPASFDSLLIAHVIEHMDVAAGESLLTSYLPYLRPGGQVLFICPQERGYASDATHVRFTTDTDLAALAARAGLHIEKSYSFPFPRPAGRFFTYNEFCVLARKPIAEEPRTST